MGARTSGWKELGDDMARASEQVAESGKKIVGKGSLNIKKTAKKIVRANSRRGYLPHYPGSITYDITAGGSDITSEIGPDRARLQGGLGRIIEYGTVNSAPIPHLSPALDEELPRFERAVADMGEQLLNGQKTADGPVTDPE